MNKGEKVMPHLSDQTTFGDVASAPAKPLTKRERARVASLLPDGVPRYVRVYDNEGETIDNFSIVFTGRYRHNTGGVFWYVSANSAPFDPQGFYQHGEHREQIDTDAHGFPPAIGRRGRLGKRIRFEDLPADVQKAVKEDYLYLWSLPGARQD